MAPSVTVFTGRGEQIGDGGRVSGTQTQCSRMGWQSRSMNRASSSADKGLRALKGWSCVLRNSILRNLGRCGCPAAD